MTKVRWEVVNLTRVGNSYGIILNRKMLNHLGIKESKKVSLFFTDQSIEIKKAEKEIEINLDLSTWGKQFDKAFKAQGKPEKLQWPANVSEEADKDWTW